MKTSLLASMVLALFIGVPFAASAGPAPDQDGDGQPNVVDNCSLLAQVPTYAAQGCDTQQDGFGNICDGDFNEDLAVDGGDFAIFSPDFIAGNDLSGTGTDMNCDLTVDGGDFAIFSAIFSGPGVPGPSGLACAGAVINGCPNP